MSIRRTRRPLLVALISGALMAGGVAAAQHDDAEACESSCVEAEDGCFDGCEVIDDPEACQTDCTAAADACIEGCGP